jgi:hypothetical protein
MAPLVNKFATVVKIEITVKLIKKLIEEIKGPPICHPREGGDPFS